MCFNISNTRRMAEIEDRFNTMIERDRDQWDPVSEVSGFNRPAWPILCSTEQGRFDWAQWGLIPFWVKEQKKASQLALKTLNARSETLRKKPSFRDSVNQRCLVPVTGFFEPHHRADGKVIPYLFSKGSFELFALAGIFSESPFYKEGLSRGFSLLTVDADEETGKIHNKKRRMPLVIPERLWSHWLSAPFSDDLWKEHSGKSPGLRSWPVSGDLYRKKRTLSGEDLLKEVESSSRDQTEQLDLNL